MGSAVLRALHVREDSPPWVLEDTVSESLMSGSEVQQILDEIDTWQINVRAALRLAHAIRTRFSEDVAVDGLAEGRHNYVLLGAGLDSFAWRHSLATSFRVWEIDHPRTQSWKRRALAAKGYAEPANLTFLPADLTDRWWPRVQIPHQATWSWLGVTMYLDREAVSRNLEAIAALGRGATLVVNFLVSDPLHDEVGEAVQATAARVVAQAGEPVRSRFRREECSQILRQAGFAAVDLYDANRLAERYFPNRCDLKAPDSTLIAVATV
jgi:methyltransferase (TIGR00027 family)